MKRRFMILPLLALTLLASSLRAQEENDHEKLVREILERLKKVELSREEIDRVRAALEKVNSAKLALKRLDSKGWGIVLDIDRKQGGETISGRWKEEDGGQGRYTLKSLGDGRYRLDAELTGGANGDSSTFKDEGTLAELRKKYKFLSTFTFVTVKSSPLSLGAVLRDTPATFGELATPPATASLFGLRLRRPSKELEFHLKLPTETTWIVDSVQPGSPAAAWGLRPLDLLTRADGEDLSELKTLRDAKRALELVRRGKPLQVALTVSKDLPLEKKR